MWSKLQRDIYKLIDPNLNLQIQCRAYRMPKSSSHNPQIPRYWITLDKDIIFDFPKNYSLQEKGQMYIHIPNISQSIREYINTPLSELLNKEFDNNFGFTDFLKASDRRLGKEKLIEWSKEKPPEIQKIITVRFK
jgi:hypothetical protein